MIFYKVYLLLFIGSKCRSNPKPKGYSTKMSLESHRGNACFLYTLYLLEKYLFL